MAGYSVTFTVVDQATRQIEAINQRMRQMRAPMERQSRAIQQFVDVSGLRRVADGFTNIGRAGLSAFSSLTRLVPVMGALTGAASIAGVARLVSTWGQFGIGLQRDADRIGTTSQQLQQLRDATVLAGGSADDMVESLKGLADASARAFTLRDPQALAWFQRAGIGLEDVNGKLRSSTELMPEVLQFLDGFKNPTDRMTAAMGLGGQSLYNLTEEFRRAERPGETLIDTYRRLNEQARQYAPLTDEQIAAQRRYADAVAALRVSFEHLGQQVGTTLAEAFTPLIQQFGEFVRTHSPQIQDAVAELAEAFRRWLVGVDISRVADGMRTLGRILENMIKTIEYLLKLWDRLHGTYQVTAKDILAGSPLAAGLSEEQRTQILAAATPAGEVPAPAPRRSLYERLGLPRLGPAPTVRPAAAAAAAAPARPPVPYTPTTLTGAVGVTPAHYQGFKEAIANIESGGKYSLKGGAGEKYSGRYQFGPVEIANTAQALGEPPPSREQFLADPAMQERYFEAYTMGHHNFLMQRSAKYRDAPAQEKLAILGYAHNQGEGGAAKWLDTNVAQADAFGTSGTRYSEAIRANLQAVDRMEQTRTQLAAGAGQESLRGDFAARTGAFGTPQQAGQQLATVRSSTGKTWRVHANAADQFQGLVNDLEERGYDISESGGGYNPRMKRGGGSGWSAHSWGTAIDINPSRLPQGRAANDLPADIGQIAAARGLRWGGAEGFGTPDPQHFEIAALADQLQARGAPAEVTGGAPVSGSVDVTVTHKNPPAGVTMTASAEGEGINLAPPRTEQQQLNAA